MRKRIFIIFLVLFVSLFFSTISFSKSTIYKDPPVSVYEPDNFYFLPNPTFSFIEYHIEYDDGSILYAISNMRLSLIIDNSTTIVIKTYTKNDVPGNQLTLYNHSGLYSIYGLFFTGANIKLELYIRTTLDIDLFFYTREIFMVNGLFYNIFLYIFIGTVLVYFFVIRFELENKTTVGLKLK